MNSTTSVSLEALADELVRRGVCPPDIIALATRLAQDELFDYQLYQRLAAIERDPTIRAMLEELCQFEDRHIRFWAKLAGVSQVRLTLGMRLKMVFYLLLRRLLGSRITLILLESIEHYGVAKYVRLWEKFRETPVSEGIRAILLEELRHEDEALVQAGKRHVRSEDVRNSILGLNDGLVEILGSIGGFYAAFRDPLTVALAASIVGVAGAISMAAGAYASVKSEVDVQRIERSKRRVVSELTGNAYTESSTSNPWRAALMVGSFYIAGALVPILPFWLGVQSPILPLVLGLATAGFIAAMLAAFSGISVTRKMVENLGIVLATVTVTYILGWLAKQYFGIEIQ